MGKRQEGGIYIFLPSSRALVQGLPRVERMIHVCVFNILVHTLYAPLHTVCGGAAAECMFLTPLYLYSFISLRAQQSMFHPRSNRRLRDTSKYNPSLCCLQSTSWPRLTSSGPVPSTKRAWCHWQPPSGDPTADQATQVRQGAATSPRRQSWKLSTAVSHIK